MKIRKWVMLLIHKLTEAETTPFIVTTRCRVELCRWSVYSDADAPQLNSGLKAWRRNSTELNLTSSGVELSCVAIDGPLVIEGHSVERVFLRQRCSHSSWWIKPHLAAATGGQYVYVGFSRRNKIHVAALIRFWGKQSGSGIRTIIWIRLKS